MGMVKDDNKQTTKPPQSYWDNKDHQQKLGGLRHDVAAITAARITPEMSDAQVEAKWRHSKKMIFTDSGEV